MWKPVVYSACLFKWTLKTIWDSLKDPFFFLKLVSQIQRYVCLLFFFFAKTLIFGTNHSVSLKKRKSALYECNFRIQNISCNGYKTFFLPCPQFAWFCLISGIFSKIISCLMTLSWYFFMLYIGSRDMFSYRNRWRNLEKPNLFVVKIL